MPISSVTEKYILVIEDSLVIRDILTHIIQDEGYRVECCVNAIDAFEYLHTMAPPQLILLDTMMPFMNADEFLREKQWDPVLADIPVAIISGYAHDNPDAIRHIVGYLEKPIELDKLMALVSEYCD